MKFLQVSTCILLSEKNNFLNTHNLKSKQVSKRESFLFNETFLSIGLLELLPKILIVLKKPSPEEWLCPVALLAC